MSERRSVLLIVLAAALAGCGGSASPQLARGDVAPLIALADRISQEGACAQARDIRALARRQTALVNEHRIPPRFVAALSSGVAALSEQTPDCVPPAPPTPPPTITIVPERDHGHDRKPKHEHEHDHGHKHHHGEGGD